MVNILSCALNAPSNSPLPSTFSLCTLSSNHILRAERVEIPSDFSSIFRTEFLETIFPPAPLPFIDNDEKSISIFKVFNLASFLRYTVTVSASPLGLAVKYNTLLPLSDLVKL